MSSRRQKKTKLLFYKFAVSCFSSLFFFPLYPAGPYKNRTVTHRWGTAAPDHMDVNFLPPPQQVWLVSLGRLPILWLNMVWDLGVETSIRLFLLPLFQILLPSNSSKPPTFICWLTSPRPAEKVSVCQLRGGVGGLQKAAVVLCWRPAERLPPVAATEGLLPFSSAKLLQQPLAVTRASFQLPELWLARENRSCGSTFGPNQRYLWNNSADVNQLSAGCV